MTLWRRFLALLLSLPLRVFRRVALFPLRGVVGTRSPPDGVGHVRPVASVADGANQAPYEKLHEGVDAWNTWRETQRRPTPRRVQLCGADLRGMDLRGANLAFADLHGADLRRPLRGRALTDRSARMWSSRRTGGRGTTTGLTTPLRCEPVRPLRSSAPMLANTRNTKPTEPTSPRYRSASTTAGTTSRSESMPSSSPGTTSRRYRGSGCTDAGWWGSTRHEPARRRHALGAARRGSQRSWGGVTDS